MHTTTRSKHNFLSVTLSTVTFVHVNIWKMMKEKVFTLSVFLRIKHSGWNVFQKLNNSLRPAYFQKSLEIFLHSLILTSPKSQIINNSVLYTDTDTQKLNTSSKCSETSNTGDASGISSKSTSSNTDDASGTSSKSRSSETLDEKLSASNSSSVPDDDEEPTYCYCNGPDNSKMIACDNPACPMEWFHVKCLGIATSQKASGIVQNVKTTLNDTLTKKK